MSVRPFTPLTLAAVACGGLLLGHAAARDYPKLAPYPAIRWTPEVWIDGRWLLLRSIDGVAVDEIVAFARRRYDDRWEKRFGEDLAQVLTEMGHPPGRTAKLVVLDPATGREKTLDRVPMTFENRESIRTTGPGLLPLAALNPDHLRRALDEFQAALDGRWSYRHASRADFPAAVAALRKRVDTGITPNDFGIALQKIVALGVDGHSEVTGFTLPPGGCLPFLVEPEGERFTAFKADRTGFVAEGFPYLARLDGKDVADWCAAAAVLVPKGSPQYVRRHTLGHVRDLDFVRGLMGLPKKETVEVELIGTDGRPRKVITVPVARQVPVYGVWPPGGSRRLDGQVGYLRLPAMDAKAVAEIKAWMPRFRDTAGLIVDVRDNGGGERDPLVLLYSYLAAPDAPPRVFTAAAFRLHPAHREGHLAERFMYRAGAKEWSDDERRAVAAFAKSFKPEWELPKGQFSDWHYMTLGRRPGPGVYHYPRPVVVLMNARCFSATDVFLAGLKGMRNVTLVGTPSGGGSALAERHQLGETTFRVRLGTMASFQADGKLFDGNGVRPDVEVVPVPEYHTGGRDNVLEEAVKRVKGS